MAKWTQTKHEGIRYREHSDRKFGIRKDRYYTIRYYTMEDGKRTRKEETLGWESEWKASHPEGTISLEQEAVSRRAQLMKNQKNGTGPDTLKKQRQENEAKQKAELARLKAEAEASRTLSEFWKETYLPAAKRSKKESSWVKEEQHFRLWIEPLLGNLPLRSIKLEQWDELTKTLSSGGMSKRSKEHGLSQRSKEYITGTLRRILKFAYDRRMTDEAPPTGKRIGVTGPGNNRRLRVISHEDEASIMAYLEVTDKHAWRITRFAFLTGCRVSEAFNIKWADVDRSRGTIIFPETKNKDSRTLPVTPLLAELFDGMEEGSPDATVFTNQSGEPYTEAPSAFKTAVENLGLNKGRTKRDRISFHSIRHTVATRLAQRLGVRDLMDVMGWRTVQMAMRYVHANEGLKARALSTLGSMPEMGNVLPFKAAEHA